MSGPSDLSHAECPWQAPLSFPGHGLGKRQGRGQVTAPGTKPSISSVTSATKPSLGSLSVFCSRLKRSFLVDSGADVSVFPASPLQKKAKQSAVLSAANGTSIKTFGKRKISLCFPGLSVVHSFFLADVQHPILGSDFFRRNDLLIDIARRRLVRDKGGGDLPAGSVVVKAKAAEFFSDLCGPVSYTHLTLPTIYSV